MEEKRLTPIKAIRAKCLDCSCGSSNEVNLCPVVKCPLYPYRFGKNPNYKYSEDKIQAVRERAKRNFKL